MSASEDGTEYHVSPAGDDSDDGSADAPLGTISAAAERAEPGDVVTVHEGTYRERVDPPRGGESDDRRIVYRAADGEAVTLKGSEVVEGWERAEGDAWRVELPDEFFDGYNPFDDRLRGDWFDGGGRDHHTGAVYLDGAALTEAAALDDLLGGDADRAWFAEVEDGTTTVRARFGGADPTAATVEVNVRPAVFYPSEPGRDYITVRGFTMCHAATQWAPPTVEQIGLLGTHWSAGWVIEDNVVSHSRCTGITLGKYGRSVDDTGATADRYNETIREARENGWERGEVGDHVVSGNHVHGCGQAGIVGSMGAAFSEVAGNHIHDINVDAQFAGAEVAGIKFHGPVDTTIRGNRVHRAPFGIWLDWMTQGTRVTGNLLYENDRLADLFVEVNHGPFVVDNNVMLSETAVRTMSQGGAYAHNLVAGDVVQDPEPRRETPYHEAHSTAIAGLSDVEGGDDRFYNNVFVGHTGLRPYDGAALPVATAGNVYLDGAEPSEYDEEPVTLPGTDPGPDLHEDSAGVSLHLDVAREWLDAGTTLVTTDRLGTARVPDLPFTAPDGSDLRVDADYFGAHRDTDRPIPGPFEHLDAGPNEVRVWPPSADG